MDKTQMIFTSHEDFLNNVIDVKGACEILKISDGYLRSLILKGEFKKWEFKKFNKAIVFYKPCITSRIEKFKK